MGFEESAASLISVIEGYNTTCYLLRLASYRFTLRLTLFITFIKLVVVYHSHY